MRTSPRLGLAVAVAVVSSFLGALSGATATAAGFGSVPGAASIRSAPPPTLYWGAWIGDQLTGTAAPYDMNAVAEFERIAGKGLSLVEFAVPFAECNASCSFFDFPRMQMNDIRTYGAIPFLNWSSGSIPADPDRPADQPDFQLADLIAGRYDSYIRSFAAQARDWGHPFFLRFDWEMNGDWFPWGVKANGNRLGEYVVAWRHVHDLFAQAGTTNATWVWCPYVDPTGKQNLRGLYPGGAYVDWTCLDAYNWGPGNPANPRPWRSFDQILGPTYRRISRRIAPRKPMILGEVASSPYGGSKSAWIRKMLADLPTRYRKVRGMIWFDVDDRGAGWPIEASPADIAAFRKGLSNPAYLPNRFGDITVRPIPPPGPG
jgi:mannan endo-1,4-beta-mannosidase